MINKTKELITKLFESDITTYRIAKDTGLSQGTLDRYRSGQSDIGNMNLKTAKELEELAMDTISILENESTLKQAIVDQVISWYVEEDIELDMIDIYYEPEANLLYHVDRGDAYIGDDKEAFEVAHIDDGKMFIDHLF